CPQGAITLHQFDVGLSVSDHSRGVPALAQPAFPVTIPGILAVGGCRNLRDNSDQWQLGDGLHLAWGAKAAIQPLLDKNQRAAAHKSQYKAKRQVEGNVGYRGRERRPRIINYANVARPGPCRNSCLFQLLRESVVQLLSGFNLVLQNLILEGTLIKLVSSLLLLLQCPKQHLLAMECHQVIVVMTPRDLLKLSSQGRVNLIKLTLELDYLRMSWTHLSGGTCITAGDQGLLVFELFDHRIVRNSGY